MNQPWRAVTVCHHSGLFPVLAKMIIRAVDRVRGAWRPAGGEDYPIAIRTLNFSQRRATRILGTGLGAVNEMARGLEPVRLIVGQLEKFDPSNRVRSPGRFPPFYAKILGRLSLQAQKLRGDRT